MQSSSRIIGGLGVASSPLIRARLKAYPSRTEVSDSEEERQRYVASLGETHPMAHRTRVTISQTDEVKARAAVILSSE